LWSGSVSRHPRRGGRDIRATLFVRVAGFFDDQSQAIDLEPQRAERCRRGQGLAQLCRGRIGAGVDQRDEPRLLARQHARPKLRLFPRREGLRLPPTLDQSMDPRTADPERLGDLVGVQRGA
jgi:hypothetical protein